MAFPRTITPRTVSPFRTPGALVSTGQSGKVQLRDAIMMGREWDETWPALDASDPDVQALLAFIEANKANTFTIEHLVSPGSGLAKNGVSTLDATPLVNGASQTGPSLVTDNWELQSTGPDNEINNPGFETGVMTPHITSDGGGSWSVQTGNVRSGTYAAEYNVTGQTTTGEIILNGASGTPALHYAVVEGDTVFAQAYARTIAASTGRNVRIQLDWRTSAGVQVTTTTGTSVGTTSVYQKITVAGTAPATTAYVVVRIQVLTSGTANNAYIDDVYVRTANVVKAGDVIRIAGLPQLFRTTADASMDAGGNATLSISPPIVAGGSPVDNADITTDDCTLTAYIASPPNLPPVQPGYFLSGLTLTFRESL